MNRFVFLSCLCGLWATPFLRAQPPPPPPGAEGMRVIEPGAPAPADEGRGPEFIRPRYQGVGLDIVLQEYARRTGRVVLRDPRVSDISINLMVQEPISVDEFLRAVEALLAMNNISIVPFRDNFIKVIPADSVVRSGIELNLEVPDELDEDDGVVSQLVALRYLEFAEVQSLVTERLSPNARVQQIDRANAILITDTRANVRRILEILKLIDRPAEVREEVRIYQIRHASASEIKGRLEELIAESQAELARQRPGAAPQSPARRTPPGVIRPGGAQTRDAAAAEARAATPDTAATPGLIRGRVQMVADDRTNILLVISRPENDEFFSRMIETLDVKVDPEITVRHYKLQFADAEEASATLNELIGAASRDAAAPGRTDRERREIEEAGRAGQTIREFIEQRAREREPVPTPDAPRQPASIGDLSETTRILADPRTNTLLLMGRNADLDIIEGVIEKLDIMLAQVLVRAIIMEVNLSENFSYGIDWLQRSLTVYNTQTVDGVPIRDPVAAFGGGQTLGPGGTTFRDGGDIGRDIRLSPGGLTYFTTFYDFNLDAVLRFAEGRSDAKVIATPVIMTTDNTEAQIRVGERRAVPTNTTTTTGIVQTQIEFINIGIDLSVRPRINPQGVVVMEVTQSTEDIGGVSVIDGNEVPNINSRELNASLAIPSGGTLALGGLVREDERESVSMVPLLGRLPFVGTLFRSKSTQKTRTELLVLISPEVVLSTEEADALTRRLKDATELRDETWHRGWDPPSISTPAE